MNEIILKDIVEEIKNVADELKGKKTLNLVEQGELLGLAEALSIIQSEIDKTAHSAVGLDFDIDKRYLF